MDLPDRRATPSHTSRRNLPLIVLGGAIAIAVPAASATVAALWSGGVIDPGADDVLVSTLDALALPSLMLSPGGLILMAFGAGVRGAWGWAAVLLWGLPLLAIAWFVSVAWLGGLAGRPF